MPRALDSEREIGRRLRLRDLHHFFVVAEFGSMAKAASYLGISQPAISELIANLEHTLGARLFDRGPRGVELTIYGQVLLKRSRAAFDELRQSVKDIEFLSDPTSGELRIACSTALSASILPPIMDSFSRSYPRVVLHVKEVPPSMPEISGLHERRYDLALGRVGTPRAPDPVADDVNIEILLDDKLVIAAGPGHPLTTRRRIKLDELVAERWILGEAGSWRYASLVEAFHAAGLVVPKINVVTASIHVITHLLANGSFVTLISQTLAHQHALKILPIDLSLRPSSIVIATLKNRTLSPLGQRFVEHAREVTRSIAHGRKAIR